MRSDPHEPPRDSSDRPDGRQWLSSHSTRATIACQKSTTARHARATQTPGTMNVKHNYSCTQSPTNQHTTSHTSAPDYRQARAFDLDQAQPEAVAHVWNKHGAVNQQPYQWPTGNTNRLSRCRGRRDPSPRAAKGSQVLRRVPSKNRKRSAGFRRRLTLRGRLLPRIASRGSSSRSRTSASFAVP